MPTVNCADAALLMLCDELRIPQEEWQRLWEAPPKVSAAGPADMALDDYSESVWPGSCRLDADREHDPARNLNHAGDHAQGHAPSVLPPEQVRAEAQSDLVDAAGHCRRRLPVGRESSLMVRTVRCAAPSHMRDQLCPCALKVNALLINARRNMMERGRVPPRDQGQNRPFLLQ